MNIYECFNSPFKLWRSPSVLANKILLFLSLARCPRVVFFFEQIPNVRPSHFVDGFNLTTRPPSFSPLIETKLSAGKTFQNSQTSRSWYWGNQFRPFLSQRLTLWCKVGEGAGRNYSLLFHCFLPHQPSSQHKLSKTIN